MFIYPRLSLALGFLAWAVRHIGSFPVPYDVDNKPTLTIGRKARRIISIKSLSQFWW